MVGSSDEPSLLDRTRSIPGPAHASSKSFRKETKRPVILDDTSIHHGAAAHFSSAQSDGGGLSRTNVTAQDVSDKTSNALPPPAPPPPTSGQGAESTAIEAKEKADKPPIHTRCLNCCRFILLSSWLNVLLVFVPVGIAVELAHVDKTIVFVLNAIAIVPLAGLLSYATESVASELGDTIGALMNVTFGNAVELIIFIALTKNEIAIVQASLLGSILANLLLILGMCFLLGGLRFREQIYNNTVTQMSACLLSLSVMSLLLPTAFHASFTDDDHANRATLGISRGTSVILLLVYVLYLLFQLKSHSYMYQSTPQHVIDEESHPGLLHDVFDSSDGSSSSTSTDSDGSSGSHTTAKRIKRVLIRGRRRRKSSASSTVCSPSLSTVTRGTDDALPARRAQDEIAVNDYASGEEADVDEVHRHTSSTGTRDTTVNFRDFESEKIEAGSGSHSPEVRRIKSKKKKHSKKVHTKNESNEKLSTQVETVSQEALSTPALKTDSTGIVVQEEVQGAPDSSPKKPFMLKGLSVRDALPTMPTMPRLITNTVFSTQNPNSGPIAVSGVTPRALHRSHSLPSRLNYTAKLPGQRSQPAPSMQPQPYLVPVHGNNVTSDDRKDESKHIPRTAAIILLVVSTALVAICADFVVESIDHFVANTSVSEAFVGLIIIPIVGNAAEHVCAVTVATKNKMDLAIGVAVGSSIQIALFVTPVIVLLGWMMDKQMSLYFSLFETISLFVSAFIVNFLVLDGRSNYLEGALLIAAYVIIAVAAFFYPDSTEASSISGADGGKTRERMMRMMF